MNDTNFSSTAFKQFSDWQINDRKIARKIVELILDIHRNGLLNGIGQPEKLKYCPEYSRRINQEHRLIYSMDKDGRLFIHSCKGHYDD